MEWYYADNGQQLGPFPDTAFASAVRAGKVTPTTLVWHSGMAAWQPYSTVMQQDNPPQATFSTTTNGTPMHTCMECGESFAQTDLVRYGTSWICATCKPIFIQKLKEGLRPGERLEYAGFWIRFAAKCLDGFITSMVTMIVQFGFGLMMTVNTTGEGILYPLILAQQFVSLAINVGYSVYFVGKFGATPGKMACRIMIVPADGGAMNYGKAFGRLCAEVLSAVLLGIGYLMAAWDGEKRALHDRLCHTRVVRR